MITVLGIVGTCKSVYFDRLRALDILYWYQFSYDEMIPPYCEILKCLVCVCVVSPMSKTWVLCRNARNYLTKFWVTIAKFVKHGQNIMYLLAAGSNMPRKLRQLITYLSWSSRWYCSICFLFRVLNVFWHAEWWLRDNHTTKHCMYPDALIRYVREERNRPNSSYKKYELVTASNVKLSQLFLMRFRSHTILLAIVCGWKMKFAIETGYPRLFEYLQC